MASADRITGVLDPLEAASEDERRAHHDEVLRRTVAICWERSPFYKARLEGAGLVPDDIEGLDDLARIPVTSKKDVQGGMLGTGTIPLEEAKRIYVSPGPYFYASQRRSDPPLERGRTPLALAFHAMGFREGDIVLNTFSYHLVPAGAAIEEQLGAAGCAVIPAGPQSTDVQAEVLAKLPVAGYVGTPTFLRLLTDKAEETGLLADWKLEVAFVTAERLPESLREDLERRTGARVRQIYGSADGLLPAYECWARAGMHLHPDQVFEVLDPASHSHSPVPPGAPGMVVATVANPNRPLLRFANLDLVSLLDDPCPCGRTGPRIERFVGRLDESTKVRGMFVYPEQIAQVMERHGVARWQAVVRTDARGADDFVIRCEGAPPPGLAEAVRGLVRLRAEIEAVAPGTIADGAKRLVDERAAG